MSESSALGLPHMADLIFLEPQSMDQPFRYDLPQGDCVVLLVPQTNRAAVVSTHPNINWLR